MGKNVVVFGRNSFDKAVMFAAGKPKKLVGIYYSEQTRGYEYVYKTEYKKREVPLCVVRGANRKFYVCNNKLAQEISKRPNWVII